MPYVECNYIRRVFREYVEKSGLDEMYDVSEERNGNVVLTSRFARHRDMGTTSRYINTDKKEIYDVIDAISVSEVAMLKKKLSK